MKTIYKFIPYEKMKWETSIKMERILGRLEANVEEKDFDLFLVMDASSRNSSKQFQGEFSSEHFRILGFTNRHDETIPSIHGKFEKNIHGHTIDIVIRFSALVYVLLGIGFLVASGFALHNLSGLQNTLSSYFPFFFPFAILGIFVYAFKNKSRMYRTFLMEMFEASEVHDY